MYNFIINEIRKKYLGGEKKYVGSYVLNYNYVLLLYLKFICDKKRIRNYSNKEKLLSIIPEDKQNYYNRFFENGMNDLLALLQTSELDSLIKEITPIIEYDIFEEIENIYLNKKKKVVYFLNKTEIGSKVMFNHTTSKTMNIRMYEMLDEIRKIKRKICNDLNDISFSEIDTLVIIDNEPAYRYVSTSKNIIDLVYEIFSKGFKGKVILKTAYSKISIIKQRFLLDQFLSKVILRENSSNNDTILIFNKDLNRKEISIVMINKDLENDYLAIKEIIENDVVNRNNLIKVEPKTIMSNNYRLGFKMYLSNNTEEVKTINDIIDENTKITEDITRLNKLIQQEMDKLISK